MVPLFEMQRTTAKDKDQIKREKESVTDTLPVVCDQLRTPLLAIAEYVEALSSSIEGMERLLKTAGDEAISKDIKDEITSYLNSQKTVLKTKLGCVQLQNGIINDLRDYANLIKKQLQLNLAPMDPISLVDQAVDILQAQIQTKKIDLQIERAGKLEPELFQGDKVRFLQILLNLLSNAVKFTPEEGKIKVIICAPQKTKDKDTAVLEFSIQDTGCGITAKQLESLFQPYQQADPKTAGQYGGTGLGLWISKALIELMGGEISAASPRESGGKGSTFTFKIKCAPLHNSNTPPSPVMIFSVPKPLPSPPMDKVSPMSIAESIANQPAPITITAPAVAPPIIDYRMVL